MKAYDIFMFLLLINTGFFITNGVGVYSAGMQLGGLFNTIHIGILGVNAPVEGLILSIIPIILMAGQKYLTFKALNLKSVLIAITASVLSSLYIPSAVLAGLAGAHAFVFIAAIIQVGGGGWRSAK